MRRILTGRKTAYAEPSPLPRTGIYLLILRLRMTRKIKPIATVVFYRALMQAGNLLRLMLYWQL